MNESGLSGENIYPGTRRLMILIIVTILIALIFVGISLALYVSSGASQLDLSRPGYDSVSDQTVSKEDDIYEYSSVGPINKDSLEEFRALYQKQSDKIKTIDAFSGDPLSETALGINAPADN
jgi:hypothetical protein